MLPSQSSTPHDGRGSDENLPRRLSPVSSLRHPLYAGLLVGDVRHDALEFSAAGMSLTLPVVESAGLGDLRRGDERAVVLCIGGADWEEEYNVVLRLAARSQTVVGFAFVGLPPLARAMLEQTEEEEAPWVDDVFEVSVAPFAFARLTEPAETSRRFILSISEVVFALTQRRQVTVPSTAASVDPSPVPSPPRVPSTTTPAGTALVYALAALALLLIVVMMTLG